VGHFGLSFNSGRGLRWWWHRLLGRGFWGAVYNFGVLFNNLEYTIGAFMSVDCHDFIDMLWLWLWLRLRLRLWMRFLLRDSIGHRKTILLGCWLGKAFELAFEFGEDWP
jgi:hypothetical protein